MNSDTTSSCVACIAVGLTFAAVIFLASEAAQAQEAPDARLACPPVTMVGDATGAWAVFVRNDGFLVVATRWDERARGRPTLATASFACAEVSEAAVGSPETTWAPIGQLMTLTSYLPRIAAMTGPDGRTLYLVAELHGGRQFLAWTAVPFPDIGGDLTKGGPSQGTPANAETPEAGWKWVHEVRVESAPTTHVAGTLRQPSLAALGRQLLLAGACYASSRNPHEVWVAALAEPRDRAIDGVFLGPGWKPALVSSRDIVCCFAVDKEDSRAHDDVPGRLVAWRSSDAERWEPWAPGVPLENVVRVDACNEGDTTLIACLTAPPEPRIHVYRLDPDKEGLTELLTVDPAPEGELGRDIAIRLLKGKAYLFWQDNVGAPRADMLDKDKAAEGKTFIVMRRLELPAEDE